MQSISYGCSLELTNADEEDFQAQCERQTLFDLNVQQINRVGEYGNANVAYPRDWLTVTSEGNLNTASFETETIEVADPENGEDATKEVEI